MRIEEAKGRTSVRLTAHLDRSGDTQVAKPIAALFDAAAKVGGVGYLRLVNDGSYSGESGVSIAIADGELVRQRLDDLGELSEHLDLPGHGGDDRAVHLARSQRASRRKEAPAKKAVAKKAPAKKGPAENAR